MLSRLTIAYIRLVGNALRSWTDYVTHLICFGAIGGFSQLYAANQAEQKKENQPNFIQYSTAAFDDLRELGKIVIQLPFAKRSEKLQKADHDSESPWLVLIQPDCIEYPHQSAPILYAPGYLDDPRSLRSTCRRYANKHGCPVYIVKYRSKFQSIEEHAKDVARVAERIAVDTQTRDLILMGHSMGGLVISEYMQTDDKAHVLLWITIGTPFQGSPLAPFGLGDCSREMCADSEFIRHINERNKKDDIPSLHIYTSTDLLVPPEYASREGSSKAMYYECNELRGHLGVRSCDEVEEVIHQAIESTLNYSE